MILKNLNLPYEIINENDVYLKNAPIVTRF